MKHTAALADRFGGSPDRVARAIERLLDARWPPFRRHVGLDARLLRTLHALLPTAWAHALWRPAFSA